MRWWHVVAAVSMVALAGCVRFEAERAERRDKGRAEMEKARADLDKTFWIQRFASVEFCPGLGGTAYQQCSRPGSGSGAFVIDNLVQNRLGRTYYHVVFTDGRQGYMPSYERSVFVTEDPAVTAAAQAEETAARQAEDERRAAARKAEAEAECRRKGGAVLGMTPEQVVATCWGLPEKKIVTVESGLHDEKWLYGKSYLYFHNGVLTKLHKSEP